MAAGKAALVFITIVERIKKEQGGFEDVPAFGVLLEACHVILRVGA